MGKELSSCLLDGVKGNRVLTVVVQTEAASVAASPVAAYPAVAWNLEASHVEAFRGEAFRGEAFPHLAAFHVHTYAVVVDHADFDMPVDLENYRRNREVDLGDGRCLRQTTTNPKLR